MNAYAKPLPRPTALTRPFWDACKAGELKVQQCGDCSHCRFYPSAGCPECGSARAEWRRMSGRGRVISWIVVHRAIDPVWQPDVPYTVAIVELEEQAGLMVPGTLTGIAGSEVTAGLPVEVWFDAVTPEITLPRWRPQAAA